MPLFRGSAAAVHSMIDRQTLVPAMSEQFRYEFGHNPSPGEQRSWERSIAVLVADLVDAGLSDVEVLLEYKLPLSSKRADAILCGKHPRTGEPSFVVVELKQWTRASALEGTDDVVVLDGLGEQLHPIEQVRRYCTYLMDFLSIIAEKPSRLAGVAYLHNATDNDIAGLWKLEQSDLGRMFTSQGRGEFHRFLQSKFAPVAGAEAADRLLSTSVRPSKQLMRLAADEVQRREQFVLLDEQQTAYSIVLRAVEASRRGNTKEVVIVTGGPGSGKSVIALSLLGELSRHGRTALHATGSSAFTLTLRRIAGARAPRVKSMFKYYNQFIDSEPNSLDVLICDEAHRIKETSTNRYTRAPLRTGRPQVEELIAVARVPVFLLDEHQVVRPTERGTIQEIRSAAEQAECTVRQIDLDAQFRCGGSRVFEHWVLRLLGLEAGGPVPWQGDEDFEVKVAATPSLLEAWLASYLGGGYSARISAGYCWRWSDPPKDGDLVPDVVIGDWARPWNNKRDTTRGGAPGTPYWATDPAGFGQVGCVYTAQGFEYDYSGVILGPDLVWRTDRWVARPEFSHDSQVKKADLPDFDRAIRNTYKVLLTRGMRGTTVYSTDPQTQDLLQRLVR